MLFGPNSNNPRLRRSYADAAIARAKRTPEDGELYREAVEASTQVGDSRKSVSAGFGKRIAALALRDQPTRAIVDAANKVTDPSQTKPVEAAQLEGATIMFARRCSNDFRVWFTGQTVGRQETHYEDGRIRYAILLATDHEGSRLGEVIPTRWDFGDGSVDVHAVRSLPDDKRREIADIVSEIE